MIRFAVPWIVLAMPMAEAVAQHADHGAQDADQDAQHADHGAQDADQDAQHADHGAQDADQDAQHTDHGAQAVEHDGNEIPTDTPSSAALSGPVHAADTIFAVEEMAAAREQLRVNHGGLRTLAVLADRFETRAGEGDERYVWDLQGWYGGDIQKLWWKSAGAGEVGANPDEAEVQMLYSRAVTPYFDFQAGVRRDFDPSPQRSHAVLGVQGLLPYVFEIDAAVFISDEGDLTGRFEVEYDLRIRQRLVLQPRIETSFSAQAVPELRIGEGLGSVEGGLRLRYELRREIAPYVGLAWQRKLGATADLARAAGDDRRSWELVVGIRAWF